MSTYSFILRNNIFISYDRSLFNAYDAELEIEWPGALEADGEEEGNGMYD